MNIKSFFSPQTIYRATSPYNGTIEVVEFFGKRELVVGGLQQSGWLVGKIWMSAMSAIRHSPFAIRNILILGLGAGSVVPIINRYYSGAKITGIEIDPVIIDVGKKYFALDKHKNLTIVIEDAFSFIQQHYNDTYHRSIKYDLIIVDLYVGERIPNKLKSKGFLQKVKGVLSKNGVVMINHLRSKGREKELKQFETLLRSVFTKVDIVKPLVNQIFLCQG